MAKIDGESQVSMHRRVLPLDALRGFIMILMALDHANFFIAQKHSSGEYWGGQFPQYQDALAFLTRFVTHPVAPGFAFLMGAGMVLFAISRQTKGWSRRQIVQHFIIRGIVLMLIQMTVINFAWSLSPTWGLDYYFGVLFALGAGMVIGSALLWLKPAYLIGLTCILFVGAELLTPAINQWGNWYSLPIHVFLVAGGDGQAGWWVNYPILQWLEMISFGMLFAKWLQADSTQAMRRARILGIVFLLLFVLIRYLDGFGNIRPRAGDSWMDILNVVKYPPSVSFTFLTMGINFLILDGLSHVNLNKIIFKPLLLFGRVPLFFYASHLYLYAWLGISLAPQGMNLPQMYPLWLLGLLVLLPACYIYQKLKYNASLQLVWRFL